MGRVHRVHRVHRVSTAEGAGESVDKWAGDNDDWYDQPTQPQPEVHPRQLSGTNLTSSEPRA
jgi:hypothetical protein